MAQNDFLTFSGDPAANAMSQSAYQSAQARITGVVAGIADPTLYNKHARQSSVMSAMLAQFIVQQVSANVVDDGTTATILANFTRAIAGSGASRVNNISGATYTYGAGDVGALTLRANSSAPLMTDLLPTGSVIGVGSELLIKNADPAGLLLIKPAGGATFEGSTTGYKVLGPRQGLRIISDGLGNYYSLDKPVLTKLASTLNVYVDSALGNDTNPGLAPGSSAFATPQAAINWLLADVDANNNNVVVNLTAATYSAVAISGRMTGQAGSTITLLGASNAYPGGTLLNTGSTSPSVYAVNGSSVVLQNIAIGSAGTSGNFAIGGWGVVADRAASIAVNNITLAPAVSGLMWSASGAWIGVVSAGLSIGISGSASCGFQTTTGGQFGFLNMNCFLNSGSYSFPTGFTVSTDCGVQTWTGTSFPGTGAVVGPRYAVTAGGVITGTGGSSTFFPGSGAGTQTTGGQYI